MKFSISVFLAAFASMALAADPLAIDTPTLVQCDRSVVSWSGGVAPFTLTRKFDGVQEVRHNLSGHSEIWMTNLPSGTIMQFEVQDSNGAIADTAETVVRPSNASGCL